MSDLIRSGVLAYDAEEISSLESNAVSPVSFLKDKIRNIEITPAQLALDPCSGSCVITDVKTGELLALVSYPGYDNNRLANTVDADYFASLNTDLSKPLYNYATQERTAPGSTFKMVSSVAGLDTGVITLTTQIMDKGVYENISNHPRCWALNHGYTHGLINVSEALRDSCNYFFYDVGYRLATNNFSTSYDDATGISKIQEYASLLGLDETTGVEIEENDPQIADEYPVMAAIGQSNNNYATIQLGRYVSAIANDGNVYEYTLLSKVCDSDGNTLETYEPKVRNTVDVLDTTQWNAIHTGMRMVVENCLHLMISRLRLQVRPVPHSRVQTVRTMRCSSDMRRTVILRYRSQHVSHSVIHHIMLQNMPRMYFLTILVFRMQKNC